MEGVGSPGAVLESLAHLAERFCGCLHLCHRRLAEVQLRPQQRLCVKVAVQVSRAVLELGGEEGVQG